MKNQITKKFLGFTLIEALIVILIFGIGMIVLSNMFLSQNRLYRSQNAELNITSSVRTALDDLDNYIRQANHTLASYSSYTASAQTLILKIQSVNSSKTLIPSTYDYVVYSLSGGKLTRQIIADAGSTRVSGSKLLASNVTTLAFTYNNANYALVTEVSTNLTCSESTGIQTRSFNANSKSKLRNF